MREFDRFVDALVRRRRPRPFRLDQEDAPALAAAIELASARPGADLPSADFVARLHDRLAVEFGPGAGQDADAPATTGTGRAREPGDRRSFLRGAAAVAAASAASAVAASAATDYLDRRSSPGAPAGGPGAAAGPLQPNDATWQPVMAAADLPEGGVRGFQVSGIRGYVHRRAGVPVAVSGVCTHQGCLLTADTERARLDCPCHRTAFALDGQVLESQLRTRPRDLAHIPARDREGQVEVLAPPPAVGAAE